MASALQKAGEFEAAEKFTSYKNHSFHPRFASGTPCITSFSSRRRGSAAIHISAESRNGAFGLALLRGDFSQLLIRVFPDDESRALWAHSVKKKRKRKMNEHQYNKLRKRMRRQKN